MGKERWIEVATSQGELLDGLEGLGNSITHLSKGTRDAFAALVSLMYMGKVNSSLDNVRYELFAKKSKTSEKLPPTGDSFHHHLRRAAYIWTHATVQYLDICPINNGRKVDESGPLVPVLMELPPAPMLFLILHCVVAVVIVIQNDVSAEKRISFARTLVNVTVKNSQTENCIRQIQSQMRTDGEL